MEQEKKVSEKESLDRIAMMINKAKESYYDILENLFEDE